MVNDGDEVVGTAHFVEARRETLRYHQELYASARLGDSGTWLARPHPIVLQSLDLLPKDRAVTGYDLGAGVGRHTIPMLQQLHPDSTIIAVDVLPSALARLRQNTLGMGSNGARIVHADLAGFHFDQPADVIVAFSAIEHLPDLASIEALLQRISAAVTPGGIIALGLLTDRWEVSELGGRRRGFLESNLTAEQAEAALSQIFGEYTIFQSRRSPSTVTESRAGGEYQLTSNLVTFIARR